MKNNLLLICLFGTFVSYGQTPNTSIVFCGDDKLVVVNYAPTTDSLLLILWQWQPSLSPEIPKLFREKYLQTIDECKPINNGKDFLVTSSKGAVALVNRASNKTTFYAQAPNAHSAELLPNRKIAVALSTADNGNAIQIFDLNKSDVVLCSDNFYAAHGVIWDNEKQVLYALGYDELRVYKIDGLETNRPALKKVESYKIPDRSGHDLQWMPDEKQLIFTTEFGVFTFDIASKNFAPFKELEGQKDVKCVTFHPVTKQLMYIKSEESWWSFHISFLNPQYQLAIPSVHLYKARWIINN